MKLSEIHTNSLNSHPWLDNGYQLPKFDLNAIREKTYHQPTWIHYGAGNIFRFFPAFTIIEKGYSVAPADLDRGMTLQLVMDKLTALLHQRYLAGAYPVTVQSMDSVERMKVCTKSALVKRSKPLLLNCSSVPVLSSEPCTSMLL